LLKQLLSGSLQQRSQNIFPVGKPAIDRRGIRSRSSGHGAHGEGLPRPLFPQLPGRIQDTVLEIGIGLPRHVFSSSLLQDGV